MRVNTGGPIPAGADAVIMVEDTNLVSSTREGVGNNLEEETIETLASVDPGENLRKPGSDAKAGEKVCDQGDVIGSIGGEIGSLVFVGKCEVSLQMKLHLSQLTNTLVGQGCPKTSRSNS